MTISTKLSEADLAEDESRHQCHEIQLIEALDYFRTLPVLEARARR
jgi:hypothetical protein